MACSVTPFIFLSLASCSAGFRIKVKENVQGSMNTKTARYAKIKKMPTQAVSDAQVKEHCDTRAIQRVCGSSRLPGGTCMVSPDRIQHLLNAAPARTSSLLHRLKLSTDQDTDAQTLCSVAVNAIPVVLGKAVPEGKSSACTDELCLEPSVDISLEALRKISPHPPPLEARIDEPMAMPESAHEHVDMPSTNDLQALGKEPIVYASDADALESLLNIGFGVFPAVEVDVEGNTSAIGNVSSFLQTGGNARKLGRYLQEAIAWVSEALSQKETEEWNHLVKMWFQDFIPDFVYRVLYDVYQALGNLHFGQDPANNCAKAHGIMAYANTARWNTCPPHKPGHLANVPGCKEMLGDKPVLHMCPVVWNFDTDVIVGTIIHEAMHFSCGLYDYGPEGYGKNACLTIGKERAWQNADNYAFFVAHLNGNDDYRNDEYLYTHMREAGHSVKGMTPPSCSYPCGADVVEVEGTKFTIGHGQNVEYNATEDECFESCMRSDGKCSGGFMRLLTASSMTKVSTNGRWKLCCYVDTQACLR